MGYRDDLSAAQARADALERQVADLEAETLRLQKGESEPESESDVLRRKRVLLFIGVFCFAVVAVASYFGPFALTAAAIGAGCLFGTALVVVVLFVAPRPGEVLVISGRSRKLHDGRQVGYRVVMSGGVMRLPFVEKVERMSIQSFDVEVSVNNAYSDGGHSLSIDARAVVKVSDVPPVLDNAIERFLGRDTKEIAMVARETIEGNMRGLVAVLTPEQIGEQRETFALEVIKESHDDFRRLGLSLETLHISRVVDQHADAS